MDICLRFWIKEENKNFLGKGRVELLEHIKASGSISKAAKTMKMSYKAAWDSIDSMNHLIQGNIVESISGGKGGGGTIVTPQGEKAIVVFKKLEKMLYGLEDLLGDSQNLDELEKNIAFLEAKLFN
ncbi:LysR family transcriptional regulator [Helicobacter sp. 11S03491-1]|uniref:winged helix-turn-helix domain-containing protein n=1 Tax=Helicobacter sp. 11S03491-1 TaxID=1476196 RepID=UPI000BA6A86F|nr:LysR family transcriptional regulator [Helicobacter sp. 11S03491-1]PAF41570.1 hypothetical protein BKH45_06625 [Helicobacter sp. 11S03491-1]